MSNRLKRMGRYILDRSIVPALHYTIAQALPGGLEPTLYSLARRKAMETSLQYADAKMSCALMFKTRALLWDYALNKISVTGTCAEFGVWKGESINHFARKLSMIYGFDSFEGLKEDWKGFDRPKGSFDLQGKLPKVAENVHLIKGWFNDTVPSFLARCPEPFAFVHIDCDTFDATEIVLSLIGPHLVPRTVLVFDEYFGYRGWEAGEFKAWSDYVRRTGTEYEYLGFSSQQVVLQIRHVPS